MVTRTGLVLSKGENWRVARLESDGTLTPLVELETETFPYSAWGWLEHDPVSGRLWLLTTEFDHGLDVAVPSRLYHYDASGALEWMTELEGYVRPVVGTNLHFDAAEGALYLAMSLDAGPPEEPDYPWGVPRTLVLERRDEAGAVVWARSDYENSDGELSSARLVGISDGALVMIATPPLIDWGPSYPLSVDPETGASLWTDGEGSEDIRIAVSDTRAYVSTVYSARFDIERPDPVQLEPARSALSVHVPPTGVELAREQLEWVPLQWRPHSGHGESIAFGRMGSRVVSVLDTAHASGIAVYDSEGTALCQSELDASDIAGLEWAPGLQILRVGFGVGIEGGERFVTTATLGVYEENEESERHHGLLIVEPPPEDFEL